jgi:hypothetical protein
MSVPNDLQEALAEQCMALRASARSFDEGQAWEAKRMSSALFMLLNSAGRSQSILRRLSLRDTLLFTSTSRGLSEIAPDVTLAAIELDAQAARYVPFCIDADMVLPWSRDLPFDQWWGEPIYRAPDGATMTRDNLVFYMRSQDGGGHVDPFLSNPSYIHLKTNADPRFASAGKPLQGALPASMRQIAHEVLVTLEKNKIWP